MHQLFKVKRETRRGDTAGLGDGAGRESGLTPDHKQTKDLQTHVVCQGSQGSDDFL